MYFLFMHNQGGRLYIHTNTGHVLCVLLWLPNGLTPSVLAPSTMFLGSPQYHPIVSHFFSFFPIFHHFLPFSLSFSHVLPFSPPFSHFLPLSPQNSYRIFPISPHFSPDSDRITPISPRSIPFSPIFSHFLPFSPNFLHFLPIFRHFLPISSIFSHFFPFSPQKDPTFHHLVHCTRVSHPQSFIYQPVSAACAG